MINNKKLMTTLPTLSESPRLIEQYWRKEFQQPYPGELRR
jgi:hypothetical protein